MNIHRLFPNLLLAITTAALLSATAELAAGPLKVNSASPDSGVQGETLEPVTIKGIGFTNASGVRFLISNTSDTGGVEVTLLDVIDDETLTASVSIGGEATVADYDIEVQLSSGRKGKGTTLFKVQAKPNQNLVNCDEFAANGTCTCMFDKDADLRIFNLVGDCQTAETLVLTNARIVGFAGTAVAEWPILTAVNGTDGHFHDSAVITNADDAVGVRYLNIRFAPDVSRGCDPANDDIQSAISFVLDEQTTDNAERASGLHVWDLTIDTHNGVDNDPMCTAIEVVREPGFTDPYATGNGNKDGQVFVTNIVIADGSYERIGIRYEGFQPLGSINPPLVNGNIIGEQYCGDEADTARAIQFGRVQLSDPSDPSSQVTGVVESNTIRMATGCATSGGVGILVVGEPPSTEVPFLHTTAEVVKNDVSGAFVGVLVDDNVADVNFSGNTMTGDGTPATGDIGICSNALSTATKGKPNIITGFDDKIIEGDCLTP